MRYLGLMCFLLALPTLSGAAGTGGGSGSLNSLPPEQALTAEERAQAILFKGIKQRDRGLRYEAKAARTNSERRRERALQRAANAFAKALELQKEAFALNPRDPRIANELGYAYRKTGDFRKAIGAYNFALDLDPNFHRATEYRAQAFLALGLYYMTKKAYLTLFQHERALADELMAAIEQWALENSTDRSEQEIAFLAWASERKKIALQATELSILIPPKTSQNPWNNR